MSRTIRTFGERERREEAFIRELLRQAALQEGEELLRRSEGQPVPKAFDRRMRRFIRRFYRKAQLRALRPAAPRIAAACALCLLLPALYFLAPQGDGDAMSGGASSGTATAPEEPDDSGGAATSSTPYSDALLVGWLPDGYVLGGFDETESRVFYRYVYAAEESTEQYLEITKDDEQSVEPPTSAEELTIEGAQAQYWSGDGVQTLLLICDDSFIVLTSNALDRDTLIQIAEGLEY